MNLKEKASRINFHSLPSIAPTPDADSSGEGARPKTAPGALMAFASGQRSDLLRENEALQGEAARANELEARLGESLADLKQWDGAKATRLIDPANIQASRFANRHATSFDTAEFAQLKEELRDAGGNVQPVKVRQIASGATGATFELVYGHRRWEACRQLGVPVLAVIDNIDDRQLFAEMDRENRARKDLSPWEQGVMYRRALDEGLYSSNRKLAEALGVDLSALGRYLVLADLPSEVVNAFPTPLSLQGRWAKALNDAISVDSEGVSQRAKEVIQRSPRPTAKETLAILIEQKGRGVEPFHPPSSTFKIGNRKATLSSTSDGGTALIFEPGALSSDHHRQLTILLKTFGKSSRPEVSAD